MTVSIILPCFNSEKTIKRALDSILHQTYQKFEVIIVDDGSMDATKSIIEGFFKIHETIQHCYIYQKNSGPAKARNEGMKVAKGEYIAFLDSDDAWHPQKLELIVCVMQKNRIDLCGHGWALEENFETIFNIDDLKLSVGSFYGVLLKNFAVTPSVVVKKEICEYFDESMRYAEDHELWLRMARQYRLYFLNAPLVILGRKPLSQGGLSANRWAMRKGEIKMYFNLMSHKKLFILLFPFLVLFSLAKHLKNLLKDFLC